MLKTREIFFIVFVICFALVSAILTGPSIGAEIRWPAMMFGVFFIGFCCAVFLNAFVGTNDKPFWQSTAISIVALIILTDSSISSSTERLFGYYQVSLYAPMAEEIMTERAEMRRLNYSEKQILSKNVGNIFIVIRHALFICLAMFCGWYGRFVAARN